MTNISETTSETETETEKRLVREMEALPSYRGWTFTYEYPGYFCHSHPELPYSVFFTPDWEGEESMPIEVQTGDGHVVETHSARLPLPREGRTGEKLLDLLRPMLDKLLMTLAPNLPKVEAAALQQAYDAIHGPRDTPRTVAAGELCVRLTPTEIEALHLAREHVRVHMAHEHSWEVRDTAMGAIGKVLTAARGTRS